MGGGIGLTLAQSAESVTFYDSICAVKKYASAKSKPFDNVNSASNEKDDAYNVNNRINDIETTKKMFGAV